MSYLIDGHNLIGSGALPGVTLADEDDEAQLVAWLRARRDRLRGKVTVVFDSGIPGGRSAVLSGGGVEVVFARQKGGSADTIILGRLRRQRNRDGTRVVTSDRNLLDAARSLGAQTLSPADFVQRVSQIESTPTFLDDESPHVRQSPAEIEEWLRLFQEGRKKRRRPRP